MKKKLGIGLIVIGLLIGLFFMLNKKEEDDKKIVIWAYDNVASIAEKAVEIYKKENKDLDYEFEVVKIGQEDMVEKIKVYLSTNSLNNLPDVFYDEDYNFLEFIKYYENNFVDLTEYVNLEDYAIFKRINVTYNDKTYAIPFDCGVGVMFYRVDLIKKAGYEEKDMENLTWNQFIEIGKKVKKETGIDMITVLPEGDMEGRLLYQSAGTWFFDENGKANIENNQAFIDSFNTIKRVLDSGIVYKTTSWDDIISSISNEKIVSLVGGSWWSPIIESYKEQSGKWRVTTMPRMSESNDYSNYSNLGGGNWFVINKSNKEIAIDFAVSTFGKSQELIDYSAETFAIVPVNLNLINNLTVNDNDFFGGEKIAKKMAEYSEYIKPVKYGLHTYEITYYVGTVFQEYLDDKLSFEDAIKKMQKEAEKVSME
ncbi:MAG: extracellular solute-binding protein [Bacilli bacterium]|nr:extracellular solute-binding protein [Bacilli bacterium]MDD4831331.1 extracellular solute-binding protein [Bacilli bacterium]